MKVDRLFVATKAFIINDGKVLILKESSKYEDGSNEDKWDVVGGRVEPGQRFDESLVREIKEETGLNVKIGKPFSVGEWRPNVRGEQWQIVATFFECFSDSSEVKLSKDHEDFKWIDPKNYEKYNIIETNKKSFKDYLEK